MRKLSDIERNAVIFIAHQGGSFCPGRSIVEAEPEIAGALVALVKKKRAYIEQTDDGPRYTLTYQGLSDAS